MVAALQKKISESATARWIVLALVAFTMLCGYFITDVMAPLKPMLEQQMGWSSSDYGFFTSAYGWFNVFLLMLIFGGMILDKMGVRFTGLMSTVIMVIGVGIKYWAIASDFGGASVTIFGSVISSQVLWAAIGYAIFGVGIEIAGITVSKIIVKWFKGKELALAMGLEMACARIGTALALSITPLLAEEFGSVSMPILLGLLLLCIGMISFVVFVVMDTKRDRELKDSAELEEPFRFRDIFEIVRIKGFWYIAILCVLFYSAVFPFLKYAPDLMFNKFGISEKLSGIIPALLPFGTILLTPFFGNLYDRRGKGATIMLVGSFMIVAVHLLFAVPAFTNWNKLGTAYALIFWIQNWGLMGVPYLIGKVLDNYCVVDNATTVAEEITGVVAPETVTRVAYDYTVPMLIFAGLGVLSILFAFLLLRENKKMGYGLQQPNIRK